MTKTYLNKRSIAAHHTMVGTFIRSLGEHWGTGDIHLSCDTALARGAFESRLELAPMIDWDAFISDRQAVELSLEPRMRHYHRYLPFPEERIRALDEWSREKLKITLHHQLLTGVVIHVDTGSYTSSELDLLESSVVRKRVMLLAPGHYWRKFYVTDMLAKDNKPAIDEHFDRLWEARRKPTVMTLYYRYPATFSSDHYIPDGFRRFLAHLQCYRCVCQNQCALHGSANWAVDHILPKSRGGTNVLINLQAACKEYNSFRKRDRLEPRTVNYSNVMQDQQWHPVLPVKQQEFLSKQNCDSEILMRIHRANCRRAHRVISSIKSGLL
jgi:hypothetical protein